MSVLAVVFQLVVAASQAGSQTPVPAPTPPAEQAGGSADQSAGTEKVCRSVKITNSRIGRKRVCKPADQWAREDSAAARGTQSAVNGKGL